MRSGRKPRARFHASWSPAARLRNRTTGLRLLALLGAMLAVLLTGGTVYLRGAVADPASVDAAAERAHGVPGVVAVVNLTTSRSGDQRSPASASKS